MFPAPIVRHVPSRERVDVEPNGVSIGFAAVRVLVPHASVVGTGIDPVTSRFSGARSTN